MKIYAAYNAFSLVTIILTLLAFVECQRAKEIQAKSFSASIVVAGDVLQVTADPLFIIYIKFN